MCRMPTNSSRVLWESRTIQIIEPICSTAGSPISITSETMPGFLTTSGSSLWLGYPYSWGEKEAKITVTAAARARLEAIIAAPSMKQKYVWRARIVLLSAAGVGTMAIVRQVGKSKRAVWRERFVAEGVDGLLRDRPRSGRPPMVGPDQVRAVVERTVPPDATHWSTRSLARAVGLGKTTIQKIWREHGLKSH